MANAHVIPYHGSPAISIDGEIFPPMMATIRTNMHGKILVDKEYYRALGKAGIRLFFLICDPRWLIPNSLDDFRREAETLLEVCPDAYILPRISLHPPKEWMEAHPDDMVRYSDGSHPSTKLITETFVHEIGDMYSLASEAWRRDAGAELLRAVREIETFPFADRIAGYFLAAGGTSEWYYINPIEYPERGAVADTSPAFRRYFDGYLERKYGKNHPAPDIPGIESRFFAEGVDETISHPKPMLAADPPPPPPCNGTNVGSFLNVNKYMHTYDFYNAWHHGTADSLKYFAKLLKEHNPNLLVGSFYGSWGWCEQMHGSNTTATRDVLDSGYIDLLANPGVYENRQPGGFTGQRQMHDSFRLRNTLYVVEEDTRTHAENRHYAYLAGMYGMTETLNVLKRDFGRNLSEDLQAWWFDQHLGGGRYKYPEVYALFARQQEVAKEAYEKDRKKENEIAFIYDEESAGLVSLQTTRESVEYIRDREIARIGAPVDQYFHEDMKNPDMPDYKLYVFLNTHYLTDAERADIHKKLAKNHATALFLYAPGLVDPDRKTPLSPAHISEFTGILTGMDEELLHPEFRIVKGAHPITEELEEGRLYGGIDRPQKSNITVLPVPSTLYPSYLYPAFFAEDEEATVLGRFADTGKVAFAVKEAGGFTSVFCGTKYIQADILRAVARFAGCHIYEEDGNVLYASKNYITIHASKSSDITLTLKAPADLFEVYEKKLYAENTDRVTFPLVFGETKTFEIRRR